MFDSPEIEGAAIEEITYEGYAPGGIAILVETTTDNRNRTVGEIHSLFSKNNGNLGEPGSVAWMFNKRGQIIVDEVVSEDELHGKEFFRLSHIRELPAMIPEICAHKT
jgi:transcriptional/translational regulatory protein YebC/TACO1